MEILVDKGTEKIRVFIEEYSEVKVGESSSDKNTTVYFSVDDGKTYEFTIPTAEKEKNPVYGFLNALCTEGYYNSLAKYVSPVKYVKSN